jgi:hypothetical protein
MARLGGAARDANPHVSQFRLRSADFQSAFDVIGGREAD